MPEIRLKIVVPKTMALHCFDMGHQGKGVRDLITTLNSSRPSNSVFLLSSSSLK
jgi:hypothetical protein